MKIADFRCLLASAMTLMALTANVDAAVALSELLEPGGSLTVGDSLVFDQFTYSGTGDVPSASSLLVQEIVDGDGNLGIRFVGGLSFGPINTDISLGYRVSTTDGTVLNATTFSGNPVVISPAEVANVMVTSAVGGETFTIFDNAGGTQFLDEGPLSSPASSLDVDLTIDSFIPATPGGRSTMSFIDQVFVQGDNVIPEPASIVIWLGTAIAVGIVPAWRRRKANRAGNVN